MPSQIGPYTVEREIGRGGMGVVYLGYDSRLDRPVAIKALPEELGAQAERLQRFEIEARALAHVTHANIAQIHGVEEVEEQRYLILEYVDGETLGDRLDRGAMGTEDAIDLGLQIASGLEAAHAAGIIHRDLKPANLKLTAEGNVKILDFGLAKTDEGLSSSSMGVEAGKQTITAPHSPTEAGVILGTAPYMSPEQARGRKVDRRTDVWAFGVVLFECLTGRNPFLGETPTDSLGAVLHRDPDWKALPKDVPLGLRRLLRRCLTRDKNRRLQDIADARVELQEMRDGAIPEDEAPEGVALSSRARLAYVGLLVLALGVAGSLWMTRPVFGALRLQRYSLHIPEELAVRPLFRPAFDVSPDGRRLVVLAAGEDGGTRLHLRDLDQREFRPLRDTEDAFHPLFSPDGEWVVYIQDDVIRKSSIRGGSGITIMDRRRPATLGAWTDGWIYFASPLPDSGIFKVSENGGTVEPLLESALSFALFPSPLPGGATMFTSLGTAGRHLYVIPAEGGEPKVLVENASMGRWTESGHVLFVRGGTLMAATLDVDRLELAVDPIPVLEGVAWNQISGGAQYSLTASGDLFHLAGEITLEGRTVVHVTNEGSVEPLGLSSAEFLGMTPNPDESRFVYFTPPTGMSVGSGGGLWILDRGRNVHTRLPGIGQGVGPDPLWSPDGQAIYYTQDEAEGSGVYRILADGSTPPQLVFAADTILDLEAISPDGQILYLESGAPDSDVVALHLGADPRLEEIIVGPGRQSAMRLSPDGEWLVYASSESGDRLLYLRRSDGTGARIQVSAGDISFVASWSPDGSRVYYGDATARQLMVADVELPGEDPATGVPISGAPNSGPTVSAPRALFDLPAVAMGNDPVATSDGEGFLAVITGEAGGEFDRIQITLNFFEELKQLAPGGR